MATNKAKLSIHLAQPQSQRRGPNPQPAAEPMPVQAHVYRTVADLNSGFEKLMQDFRKLRKVPYFHPERLTALHNCLCRLRAEANQEFIMALSERETANTGHFDQLRRQQTF